MSWADWIRRNNGAKDSYDDMLETVSKQFGLKRKSRKDEIVDLRHYVAEWYLKNKWKFKKYKTNKSVAPLLGLKNHFSVSRLNFKREKKKTFEENTKYVAIFLQDY